MLYLVTVKLDRNPAHNPTNKITGWCPAQPDKVCTDVTGQHHTILVEGATLRDVHVMYSNLYHVTRVEEV
jgi:hypothetical protein